MDGLLQTKGYLREFTSGTRWWTVSGEDEEVEDTILKYGDFIGKLLGSLYVKKQLVVDMSSIPVELNE